MRIMLCGALVGAVGLLATTVPSRAQMWNWGLSMCNPGFTYDAKRDVCVAGKKGRRAYRKRRKGMR